VEKNKKGMRSHRQTYQFVTCIILIVFCVFCHAAVQINGSVEKLNFKVVQKSDSAYFRQEHTQLLFPSGHQYFDSLYNKLEGIEVNDSQLRILHMGGSHVQAGVFTGRMRENFQVFHPQKPAGAGIIFPFSALGTNAPKGYSFSANGNWEKCKNIETAPKYALGLSGATIVSKDNSSSLTLKYPIPFEHILLFGKNISDTAWVYPILIVDGDTIYPPKSSEEAAYEFLLSNPTNECTLALTGDSCGRFAFRGMIADPYSPGITYSASGINGASVPSWLRCQKLEEELQLVAPDLVIFGIGINDANVLNFSPEQFKANYRQLISRIRNCNPNCALLFITNNDCYLRVGRRKKAFNKNTSKAEQAFIELATEYKGAVWNLYQVMGGYGSSSKWVKAGLMKSDHVHFTERGYTLLGDLLFNSILSDYMAEKEAPKNTEDIRPDTTDNTPSSNNQELSL